MIVFSAIQTVTLAQLTLCGLLLPTLAGQGRPFDVPVPDDAEGRARATAVRRRYRAVVTAAGAAVAAVTVGVTWHATVITIGTATAAGIAVLSLSGWLAHRHAHAALLRAFANLPRAGGARPAGESTGANRFPARWTGTVVALQALTVAIGAVRYHNLPAALAIRWTAGLADRYAPTTAEAAFSLVSAQLLVTLTVPAVIGSAWHVGTGGTPTAALRAARALLASCACVELCLLAGSLILWGLLPPFR